MKAIDRSRTTIFMILMGLTTVNAQSIKVGEPELLYTEDEIPIRYERDLPGAPATSYI